GVIKADLEGGIGRKEDPHSSLHRMNSKVTISSLGESRSTKSTSVTRQLQ
ncbi:hypothetical protein FCV25MIE_34317, partial [Fagus crenata]